VDVLTYVVTTTKVPSLNSSLSLSPSKFSVPLQLMPGKKTRNCSLKQEYDVIARTGDAASDKVINAAVAILRTRSLLMTFLL